jgi:zinc protease
MILNLFRRPTFRPVHAVAGLLLAGVALTALPARTGTLDSAQIKETVLPNGLRLLVKEARATDLAAVQVWIRAGGFREDEATAGTAHALEHLLFKASERRESGSLDDEIENLGGLLEATTEKDWTRLGCTVNGRYAGKVIGLVAEVLRKPQLRATDLEAEKPVILEEINAIRFNPEAEVSRKLFDLAFQKHPYKHDVRGTESFIRRLTLESVRGYFQKHYTPANMTVIVVGDVDQAGIERAVRAAFPPDPLGTKPAVPASLPPQETACEKAERFAGNSAFPFGVVGLAFPAPSVADDPDVYAMDVLLTLMEHDGTGRLPRAVRGLPIQSTFQTQRQRGLFTVIAVTGNVDPDRVEPLLRKELDFAGSNEIPEAEITLAKRMLRGSYAMDNETYAGQASSLGFYASIDRWQFAANYLANIERVTPEQVQAVARKYLKSDHSVAVTLKPRSAPQPMPRIGT